MAASGVGQFSINVKSNLRDFYGDLTKAKRTLKELTDKKSQLQVDSSQLDKLRDKSQRIAAEMRELRQQKIEIKLGMRNVENADKELKNIDQKLASLNRQKLEVDAEIQPIRTANVELHKVDQEIDRINGKKVEIDVGEISGKIGKGLDDLSSKVMGIVKAIGAISFSGLAAGVGVLKEAVNAASDLEQNTGGVEKLYGDSAQAVMGKADQAYKTAGLSANQYLEQSTAYSASLITSLGGDQVAAAKYVDKALVDMSDNANTFGTDIGRIQDAYGGIAKGNYSMLDNLALGFKATQEGAIEVINTYGGLDHEITDISDVTFPKMIDAIHNAQKAMNISGTTAKEAATTYEGSLKMMTGAWENFLSTGDTEGLEFSIPIYLDNLDKKLKDLTPKIIDGVKKMVKELPPRLKPVIEDIRKILEESIDAIFGKGTVDNFVNGMKPFTDIIKNVFDMLSKSTEGEKPDFSWVGSVVPGLLKLASVLKIASVAFKGISVADKLGLNLPSFGGLKKSTKEIQAVGINDLKSLGLKMLTIAGISANIYLAAKSLQEVKKIGDLKELQPKLLAIAEAVLGMGVLTAAAQKVGDLMGGSLMKGIVTIAAISANIYLAAKALQEVGKIDPDFGSIQAKIGQIALCITEIGVLALAVGAIMSTGIGAVALAAGLVALIGIGGTLTIVAKEISYIGTLEIDKEKIRNNLEAISESLMVITLLSFDQTIIEQVATLVKQVINLAVMSTLLAIGLELQTLQNFELDKKVIMKNIETIFGCLDYIGKMIDGASVGDLIEKVNELLTNLIDMGIIAEFIVIANQLKKLENIDLDQKKIESTIKVIKNQITNVTSGSLYDAVKGVITGGIKSLSLVPAIAIFGEIKKIGDILVQIQKLDITEESLQEKINIIKNAIESISSFATDDLVNNLTGLAQALDVMVAILMQKFPPKFNELGQLLAKKMNDGFRSKLDLQKVLSEKIKLLNIEGARAAGAAIADAINSGLSNSLNIGDTIRDAINSALQEKYSTKIEVELETTETKKSSSDSKKKTSKTTKASGGLISVPNGYKAEIQDSPEKPLLDNGEYVIPEKIVTALGVPFFEKLRSGQISRTFAGLAQSVSHTTSSVVNNTYNTNSNNTQNMNVYTNGNEDLVLKANRRFRMA